MFGAKHKSSFSSETNVFIFTHHQFRKACMQLLCRWHGGAELQQLQRHGVLKVDLQWLAASKAAQEAQARPCPLPGRHTGYGGETGSGGAEPGR